MGKNIPALAMKAVHAPALFSGADRGEKFKIYRELWQKAGSYQVLTSFPLHLDLELSGVCNFKCSSCFQNGLIEKPLGLMDYNLFTKIIDEGVEKGLCAIKLQIRGESFLHPRIFDCIRYAKDKGVLDVQITTNGSLLNDDNIQQVLDSGLDAIIFSVDSHHGDNFSRKKGQREYASVERVIEKLLHLRKVQGRTAPWVRLQSSIPDMNPVSFEKAKNYLIENFPDADINVVSRIYNFRDDVDAYPDLHENYTLRPCSYLMHRLAVFWNGEITACCSDYNNRFQLGDANTQTIEEVWLSEKMNGFRALHKNGQRLDMSICRHCVACLSPKTGDVVVDQAKCHIADYSGT